MRLLKARGFLLSGWRQEITNIASVCVAGGCERGGQPVIDHPHWLARRACVTLQTKALIFGHYKNPADRNP